MTTPLIYHHPNPQTSLLLLLRSHLPHSIPVLRRIQHGLAYPTPSGTVLATFPPETPPSPTTPWLAAYVDLFRGRETQIYIYSSLEREASSPAPKSGDFVSTFGDGCIEKQAETRAQLLAFLAYVKANLLPAYLSSSVNASDENRPAAADTGSGVEENPFASLTPKKVPPPPPTSFLFGTMHTALVTLLTASGTNYSDPDAVPGVRIVRRDDPPYIKYLFRPEVYRTATTTTTTGSADAEQRHTLPPGYRFHDRRGRFGILPHHHALVSSRTHIPRSSLTLSRMPGVAVYYDGDNSNQESPNKEEKEEEMPIAWAFLGYDGSLATLHVEPEHRGRGIGMQVSREAMRSGFRAGGIFRAAEGGLRGEDELGYTDVLMTNRSSRRVMEKLGGEMVWTDTWAVVELL